MLIFWILLSICISLAILVTLISFYFTRRFYLKEIHTPDEFGLAFEEVAFPASDGLMLGGWFVFDFRAHGRSEGLSCTFGYLERWDVLGAVKFLKSRQVDRIALLGFSLGGITASLSAPICPEVDVVIDDGGPARMRSALSGWCKERKIPGWIAQPLIFLTLVFTSIRFGTNLYHYEPVRWIGKIAPRPYLMILGELDQFISDFDDKVKAAPSAEVWRLPNTGHVQAVTLFPEQYWQRVLIFLKTNL